MAQSETPLSKALVSRLDELGVSRYALSQTVAERRGESDGQVVYSAVSRAIADPDNRRFSTVREVIEAMGGELVIRWQEVKEIKL